MESTFKRNGRVARTRGWVEDATQTFSTAGVAQLGFRLFELWHRTLWSKPCAPLHAAADQRAAPRTERQRRSHVS